MPVKKSEAKTRHLRKTAVKRSPAAPKKRFEFPKKPIVIESKEEKPVERIHPRPEHGALENIEYAALKDLKFIDPESLVRNKTKIKIGLLECRLLRKKKDGGKELLLEVSGRAYRLKAENAFGEFILSDISSAALHLARIEKSESYVSVHSVTAKGLEFQGHIADREIFKTLQQIDTAQKEGRDSHVRVQLTVRGGIGAPGTRIPEITFNAVLIVAKTSGPETPKPIPAAPPADK